MCSILLLLLVFAELCCFVDVDLLSFSVKYLLHVGRQYPVAFCLATVECLATVHVAVSVNTCCVIAAVVIVRCLDTLCTVCFIAYVNQRTVENHHLHFGLCY